MSNTAYQTHKASSFKVFVCVCVCTRVCGFSIYSYCCLSQVQGYFISHSGDSIKIAHSERNCQLYVLSSVSYSVGLAHGKLSTLVAYLKILHRRCFKVDRVWGGGVSLSCAINNLNVNFELF